MIDIDLLTIDYSKLTNCKKKCKEILDSYKNGDTTSLDETEFLTCLFKQYHPDWEDKTRGSCVLYYERIRADRYNTSCFKMHMEDGREDDISYTCLKKSNINEESRKRLDIKNACRSAVDSIIKEKRQDAIRRIKAGEVVHSEVSGAPILSVFDVQVDHYELTFAELVDKWIALKGIDYLSRNINMGAKRDTVTRITDKKLEDEFVKFHNENTKLRIVTKHENQSLRKFSREGHRDRSR